MSLAYDAEQQVAIAAVRRACALTASVFNKLVKNETLTKDDKSPVTGQLLTKQCILFYMLTAYQSEISPHKLWSTLSSAALSQTTSSSAKKMLQTSVQSPLLLCATVSLSSQMRLSPQIFVRVNNRTGDLGQVHLRVSKNF